MLTVGSSRVLQERRSTFNFNNVDEINVVYATESVMSSLLML